MTTLIEYPQLVLPVRLRDEAVFDSFYPGPNGAVVSHLRLIAEGPAETVVWIWGATGSGKTHLLQAACAAATGSAVYLPLSDHRMSDPSSKCSDLHSSSPRSSAVFTMSGSGAGVR